MTGLIVSVGITVDSYVVYFERLKDEVRAGRSIRSSVDRGFKSAYRTILSADAVSFLGALVLWVLSIGAVRGFAFMLGLSTLVDVITAYIFTRPLVILLGRNRDLHRGARSSASPGGSPCRRRLPSEHATAIALDGAEDRRSRARSSGVYYGQTRFDFVRKRKWWFAALALVIIAGLDLARRAGPQLQHRLRRGHVVAGAGAGRDREPGPDRPDAARPRRRDDHRPRQREHPDPERRGEAAKNASGLTRAETNKVAERSRPAWPHRPASAVSIEYVGPSWGSQITHKAVEALIVFLILIAAYISIFFEWQMALAAIVAVAHDIIVTVGIYSLSAFLVTPDTVVAFLTILGYSLYDTIVVFDRVRDNSQQPRRDRKADVHRRRQPLDEPDPRPLDQHLARRDHADPRRARPRRRDPRRRHAPVLRPGAAGRPDERGVLVDLHRLAARRDDEGARAALPRRSASGSRPVAPATQLLSPAAVAAGALSTADAPSGGKRRGGGKAAPARSTTLRPSARPRHCGCRRRRARGRVDRGRRHGRRERCGRGDRAGAAGGKPAAAGGRVREDPAGWSCPRSGAAARRPPTRPRKKGKRR